MPETSLCELCQRLRVEQLPLADEHNGIFRPPNNVPTLCTAEHLLQSLTTCALCALIRSALFLIVGNFEQYGEPVYDRLKYYPNANVLLAGNRKRLHGKSKKACLASVYAYVQLDTVTLLNGQFELYSPPGMSPLTGR
jgi:hypothetical protein